MNNDYRITIIDNDGSVLADSETGNPETMKITKTERKSRRLFKTALEQRCAIPAQSKEV